MDAICYVCNEESSYWRRNFTEIKSEHTQTSISQFIRKFLGDFKSFRNIDSEVNCICAGCLHKINDYDLACQHAIDQEVKLRDLLWTTEAKLIDGSVSLKNNNIDFDYDAFESVDSGNDELETKTPEPNQTVPKPTVNSNNEPVSKPPVSKSIVVRQGDKLLKIRPMTHNATPKPMGAVSLKDVPIGALLKTKDGKLFRIKAKNCQSTTTTTPDKNTTPVSKVVASNSVASSSSTIKDAATPSTVKTLRKLVPKPASSPVNAPKLVQIMIGQTIISNMTTAQAPVIKQTVQCTCKVCGNIFLNEGRLRQHMREHDTPPPTGALAAATKVSSSEIPTNNDDTATGNVSTAKVRPEAIQEKRTWTKCNIRRKCDECGECFRTKKLLGRHFRIHGKACDICDKRYKSLKGIRKHMKWHALYPGFVCIYCHFRSDDKPSYKEHMELHNSKSSPFICVFCDRVFEKARPLRRHSRSKHATDQCQILCDECGREFNSMDKLNIHKRIHSDKMPYECAHCSKRFKWKRNLSYHMETHNTQRDRPFACAFCGMRFLRTDHCRTHERRHKENTKTESCPFCTATYEHKFHLKQHIKRKHNAEMPAGCSNGSVE